VRKSPQIIKAHDVIGVRVRKNDRIDTPNILAIEDRSRWSRGSGERQTSQSQPIIGTPCDVPVPRKVTVRPDLRVEG